MTNKNAVWEIENDFMFRHPDFPVQQCSSEIQLPCISRDTGLQATANSVSAPLFVKHCRHLK